MFVPVMVVGVLALAAPAPFVGAAAAQDEPARLAARRTPVVQVFENNRDAVVNISSKEIVTVRDPWGGFDSIFQDLFEMPGMPGDRTPGSRQITRTSVGSGFVIHEDGYIITNAHVVAQTAERKAIFADGREYDAQVVAFDTQRDLAILKVETDKPLPIIRLGRSDDLMIGETVIAIGNPVGLQNTVTAGVISATDRRLDFARGQALEGLIQTDASINPGNSGGPLLNVLGELIGVNTAIRGDAQNIGFAIPVDRLRAVLPDLLDVERRYRIIDGLALDTQGLPRVTSVETGSPAARAGVQVGDVVTGVNSSAVRESIDYAIALIGCRPKQTIELELKRDGRAMRVPLTLEGRPAPDGPQLARERLGMMVEALTADLAEALGLPPGVQGLIVAQTEPGAPAAEAGMQVRDVLIAIGRHSVTSIEELGQLLEFVNPGERVPVTVLRIDRRTKMKLSGEVVAR